MSLSLQTDNFTRNIRSVNVMLSVNFHLLKSLISRIIILAKEASAIQNALRIATATEVQNNFGKYLQYAVENGEVVILRNGKRVARLISEDAAIGYLTDSLRGVLKHVPLEDDGRSARTEKYGLEEGAR